MLQSPLLPAGRKVRARAAFTIVEVMMAAAVLAIALGSVFALNGQVMNSVRRGVSGSFASQLIQERMEQFRRAAWTELTSNYPVEPAEAEDVNYDADMDPGDEAYVDDTYPSEFPFGDTEMDNSVPGLEDLMATSTASAARLDNVVETVIVQAYNASSAPIEVFDPDSTVPEGYKTIVIGGYDVGGTKIEVERKNGVVTTKSHNIAMVLNTTIRLTFRVQWSGTDGRTRTKETVTLFTVEGDK